MMIFLTLPGILQTLAGTAYATGSARFDDGLLAGHHNQVAASR
jgi:hypothetical protein